MTGADYPRRAHVYWGRLPEERKRRPALVVSPDARNRLAVDLLVVPLSTSSRPGPTHVHLGKGEAGLPRDCFARCEQITNVAKERLARSALGGPLGEGRMGEIVRAILRALAVPVP